MRWTAPIRRLLPTCRGLLVALLPALAAGGPLLASGSLSGCGSTCSRNPNVPPTRYTGGTTNLASGSYETSPPEGPYLHFPAGRTYLLEHGLGEVPISWQLFVAFEEHPLPAPDAAFDSTYSNVAQAAGNQAVVEQVTSDHLQVRNDTCADVYLRAVVWRR